MKQILFALDDVTARRLERVAPARSHRRSEFVRSAIRRALDALAEREMDEAYRRVPEQPGDDLLDREAWGEWKPAASPRVGSRAKKPSRPRTPGRGAR